ncbi:hypothetical protein KVR01_013059 [Diaporthe batatas]|uniref:uncharacterized protein n=1 Tax=Diaporthe batatas TaxID=748121 RepID=UPI001D04228F|nr:uncharacterized protein KVR01_013059 [Diaporthe batatas]KAG8157069.1 hypothetical protein KVR01_013059 [Diaporthe batatas]
MASTSELSPAELAARGLEITGREMFQDFPDDIEGSRVGELMAAMQAASPTGGTDMAYGGSEAQRLRLWTPAAAAANAAPIIVFVHGGSWKAGTYLDSVGSLKVSHLVNKGYAFASVNYTLIPTITVEEQVQEVADAVGFLAKHARTRTNGLDPERILLMGHSSGAHVATLLGTDTSYLARAGVDIRRVRGVVSLDGSNFNAATEMIDSPGPVAQGTAFGLGWDMARLRAMSPSYHARAPNAQSFLLFQAQRLGDIRQAVELSLALGAAGTECAMHVFEGPGFEGHVAMLLRLGDPSYPATAVLDRWLDSHIPVA